MNHILENVFATQRFENSRKQIVEVHSETSRAQCEFLQDIIRKNKFKSSVEVGFAYGTSTLAIVEEIAKNGGIHTVMDPTQSTGWGGNGLDLVTQGGYIDKLNFIEEYSYKALPALLAQGNEFDFAYIDTVKEFDFLMVDFFYIDKMLRVGGVITFDDLNFSGISKLVRFLSQLPHYKVYGAYPVNYEPTIMQKLRLKILRSLPFADRMLKAEIIKSNSELGINTPSCIALIKVDTDKRNWDWHVSF